MIRFDLRLRIATTIAAICIAIVTLLGVTLYMASGKMESALVEQLVSEELSFLIQHHKVSPNYIPALGPNIQYYVVRTSADEVQLPHFVRGLKPGIHEIDIGKDDKRDIAIQLVGDTRFIVVYNIGPYEEREREFRQLLLLSLLGVIGIALILGYSLAGILTRQLTQLARHVTTLIPNAPHSLFRKADQDQEVAVLAQALDQYQIRILEILRREQEFTANVSHELRTPLTTVSTSCELLVKDPNLTGKSRERINYISQATDQMTGHIQALLFLAREKELADIEFVILSECINTAALLLRNEISRKGLELKIDISPPDAIIEVSRQAFYLVLTNLLRNAVYFTEHGFIHVKYIHPQLMVSDSGVGIIAEELPQIFERSYRGGNRSGGSGIGLDIVKRICEKVGWTIEVDSVPSKGSTFTITFC